MDPLSPGINKPRIYAMADVLQKRSTTRNKQTTIADFFKK